MFILLERKLTDEQAEAVAELCWCGWSNETSPSWAGLKVNTLVESGFHKETKETP